MYDFIREMKVHKQEAIKDIFSLKEERSKFENIVRAAELGMGLRVNEMQKIHTEFSGIVKNGMNSLGKDIEKVRETVLQTSKDSENFKIFMQKLLIVTRRHGEELKSIKVQMGETTIFKTGK